MRQDCAVKFVNRVVNFVDSVVNLINRVVNFVVGMQVQRQNQHSIADKAEEHAKALTKVLFHTTYPLISFIYTYIYMYTYVYMYMYIYIYIYIYIWQYRSVLLPIGYESVPTGYEVCNFPQRRLATCFSLSRLPLLAWVAAGWGCFVDRLALRRVSSGRVFMMNSPAQ